MEASLSRSVAGLTALVTGAGSGMGRATAEVFAAEGANVAATDLSEPAVHELADALKADGFSVRAWALDVADPAAIAAVTAEVAEHFGGLDILINNAGVSAFAPIDAESYGAVWDRALAILLTAHQRLVRAALPHLRRSRCPRIVNIASTEALGATARDSPYAAAKAGVGPDPRPCGRARPRRDHRQLHLSGADPDRHDGRHSRGRPPDLRPPQDRARPLWPAGGGGAHDAQPLPACSFLHHGGCDPGGRRADGAQRLSCRLTRIQPRWEAGLYSVRDLGAGTGFEPVTFRL